MKEQSQNIRDKRLFKFASSKRYIKIHVPDFAFKHDNNNVGKDKFIGRELQIRRLYTWLTSDSKSGSYLITGYRGMGKSLLVKRVIDMISRDPKAYKEVVFQFAMILAVAACYFAIVVKESTMPTKWTITTVLAALAIVVVAFLEISKRINGIHFEYNIRRVPLSHMFDKDMLAKVWLKNKDRRDWKFSNIDITINLGQEVLHERDVLSLIAQNVREKYYKYVHNRQSRPFFSFVLIVSSCIVSFYLTKKLVLPVLGELMRYFVSSNNFGNSWMSALLSSMFVWLGHVLFAKDAIWMAMRFFFYLLVYHWFIKLFRFVRKKIPYFSVPFNALERLDKLCDRISSSINEEQGAHPQYNSSFFNFSFGKEGKSKTTPKATVGELEQELLGIINNINGIDCPKCYRAQFIIVFDELDKITKAAYKDKQTQEKDENENESFPEFDTSVKGFTDTMAYEERKQNVLRLLANMKLFIASVKAKCVFISGHELFDASLADLSDREFAISSIFNGVLNVSSFLSPEHEGTDVSSMTEVYLATMLLPESFIKSKLQVVSAKRNVYRPWISLKERIVRILSKTTLYWPIDSHKSYLKQKIEENILNNGILKDELPSLRWFNQYLMEVHILNKEDTLSKEEIKEYENEIHYVIEFLRNFCVYLSHISNGSPKKIATYFEKYVRVNYDTIKQFDWHDEIEVGQATEDNVYEQCVLFFDLYSQKLVNFVHYIAAPVMNAITNEVSHYGDKLLVSSSFILDQIYKYHGKGFSWRNLEQMPELLTTNKNPELRESMASIMEFLLQTHITTISSSIFQYKFHKQIAEEISMLSKTSEEAAAIFNFTLNESETVKRYNVRLLWNYLNLTNQTKEKNQKERYSVVFERLHENQGDIFFSEEDYYRAIHEYCSALQYIDESDLTPKNLIAYLRCTLKIGMSYEYRHTFENAYMVYCQIINNLIKLRWFDEKELGLDYTMRLTHDWRIKQTVLTDEKSLNNCLGDDESTDLRQHFKPCLLEDLQNTSLFNPGFRPEFGFESDKTVSSMSKNFTPKKSDILLKLTAFEDIKFIYNAIIAKLFVIEKMESSGITQSSIDAAEAEFITLYSTSNHSEKFILAADFFSKVASILYYKNAVVSASSVENILSALNVYDIDIMSLIDDYCYFVAGKTNSGDAIRIKDDVNLILSSINFNWIENINIEKQDKDLFTKLYDEIKNKVLASEELNDYFKNEREREITLNNLKGYFGYLDEHKFSDINLKWKKLVDCFKRRNDLTKEGLKLPCSACKYANRSLSILMAHLFDHNNDNVESRVITLLSYSSHSKLHRLRPEFLFQLASSSEQLADIMVSCACTDERKSSSKKYDSICDTIGEETIDLLLALTTPENLNDKDRNAAIKKFCDKTKDIDLGKLNRALLYYWAASRYYDIASMHYEAIHCIWRITSVIEQYLSVLSYNEFPVPDFLTEAKASNKLVNVLNHLFTQASRIVGRQYDNYNSVEIHELKWLMHYEHVDDIDLTHITQFPNLQSIFLSIVNCNLSINKFKIEKFNKRNNRTGKESIESIEDERDKKNSENEMNQYVKKMYLWLTRNRHIRTFKSDVELNYFKAKINYYIFDAVVGGVFDVKQKIRKHNIRNSLKLMHTKYYLNLIQLFDRPTTFFEKEVFNISNDAQSRLDLIDFLIEDSIACLCDIISVLPPHNQFSSFSNSFIASVYSDLWEWSKYYEVMYNAYYYYRYYMAGNVEGMNKMKRYAKYLKLKGLGKGDLNTLSEKMCAKKVACKDHFGYRYSKLNMNLRHDVDDTTLHHIYISYSAEMAIKYYRAARGINSEGQEYKNLINTMHILDDDLRNDTCQSNLADERYLLNSGVINNNRLIMQGIYKSSRINDIDSFESYENLPSNEPYVELYERFADSAYLNTEY